MRLKNSIYHFRSTFPLLLLFTLLASCDVGNQNTLIQKPPPPILLIIGHDDSETFKHFTPLPKTELENIAQAIAQSGRGGIIALSAIGKPSEKPFLRCIIQPTSVISPSKTLRIRAKERRKREATEKQNAQNIQVFLRNFEQLNIGKNQQAYTDINGFHRKALRLLNEPQYKTYQKTVLIYSDGRQDVRGRKKLTCSFESIPQVELCTIGWKSKRGCRCKHTTTFESTLGFTQYFTNNFKNN